jgi:hypothetical protein
VIIHSSRSQFSAFVPYLGATLFRHEVRGQIGSDEDLLRLLIGTFAADWVSHNERTILVCGRASSEDRGCLWKICGVKQLWPRTGRFREIDGLARSNKVPGARP